MSGIRGIGVTAGIVGIVVRAGSVRPPGRTADSSRTGTAAVAVDGIDSVVVAVAVSVAVAAVAGRTAGVALKGADAVANSVPTVASSVGRFR